GILIRSGEAIQAMRDVRVVVFDKTGTLTKGEPGVTDQILSPGSGISREELLRWTASVEIGSEHPLGKAIVRRAEELDLPLSELSNFEALRGKGVRGVVDGKVVWVGSRTLLEEQGISASALEDDMRRLENEGKTTMLVMVGGELMGVVAVADTLKDDSVAAVRELKSLGLRTVMLTGDNQRTAQAIARQVGIDEVLAEVLPGEKLDEIKRLQEELDTGSGRAEGLHPEPVEGTKRRGGLVAMVGDGINDAPALTQADIGIAIGTGTDIAIEAADITLVRGNLSGVVSAVKLSRATFNKVVQGLFWAFFYNVVMIPLAILGLMHPVLAEIAMAMSSITVVTNANLLRRVDIRPTYLR
ncbi:MAG: heavy metal translocating P-type ATPase, partial [Anaerolineae bacterium]|nr:heavy metal translocating P-type ATPase [Anaerolineae bacterium]